MSESVFLYQIAILVTTIVSGCIFNKKVALITACIWLIWTATMVFSSWLYLLQTITITGAILATYKIAKRSDFPHIQRLSRKIGFIGSALLCVIVIGSLIYTDSQNIASAPYLAPMPPTETRPSQGTPESPYQKAVAEIEYTYPMLNPDLPEYNPQRMQQVMESYKRLLSQNVLPHIAVRNAADGVMQEQSRQVYRCKNNVFQDSPCT